jgi:hypothetical protein
MMAFIHKFLWMITGLSNFGSSLTESKIGGIGGKTVKL